MWLFLKILSCWHSDLLALISADAASVMVTRLEQAAPSFYRNIFFLSWFKTWRTKKQSENTDGELIGPLNGFHLGLWDDMQGNRKKQKKSLDRWR